jgi:hypothetical protein
MNATDYHSVRISRDVYLWYYAQRFTTTSASIISQVELVLRKSRIGATGNCYIHIFTDKNNEPLAYWATNYFTLESLDTAFTKKVFNVGLTLLPNTNYWVALICENSSLSTNWLDWANTDTPYPAPTAYAKISNSSESWSVTDSRNSPRIMRITALAASPVTRPTLQSSGIYFTNLLNYQTDIGWVYGNGNYNTVFMKAVTTGTPTLTDHTTYTANPIFGQGSTDGNGWYCVYKGTDNSVTVSGLTPGTTYRVMVLDYNGTPGNEMYNTSAATGNPANVTTITACTSLPGNAGTINGSPIVCAGSNGLAFNVNPILSSTSYNWSYTGTGATITGTGNAITIDFADKATSGILTVKGKSACGEGPSSPNFSISINPLPDDGGSITGAADVVRGNTGLIYSVPDIVNATSYVWSYSGTGATIHGTSKTVSLDFSSSATSGILTVKGHNACGDGATSQFFPITVNILPGAAGAITGSSSVCSGTLATHFSTTDITNASIYVWEYTGNGVTINGNGTKSVTLDFSLNATSGNLTVKGHNLAGDGQISAAYPISVDYSPSDAGQVIGTSPVCAGSTNVIYSIDSIDNATSYIWNYSGTGVTFHSSGKIVKLDFSFNATGGNLTIKGHSSCGDGLSSNYPIIVTPLPDSSSSISGFSTICAGTTGSLYSINPLNNATSYNWVYSGSNAVINGNDKSVTIDFGKTATNGILSVRGHNSCGDGSAVQLSVTVQPLAGNAENISGASYVCDRTIETIYSTNDITNAQSYIWNYSGSGAVITGNSKSVSIRFLNAATDGNLTVKGSNACGEGFPSNPYPITVGAYPDKPVISGVPTSKDKILFCPADTIKCINYNTSFAYQWFKEDVLLADQTTYRLKLEGNGTGIYKLLAINKNCSKMSDSIKLVVNDSEMPEIVQKQGGGITILLVDNINNNFDSYHWTFADNSEFPASIEANKQFIVLNYLAPKAGYKAHVTDRTGCKAVSEAFNLSSVIQKSAVVYPVVNNGKFSIQLKNQEAGDITIKIIGSTGMIAKVLHYEKNQDDMNLSIDAGSVNEGIYIIEISVNGTKEFDKIIVKR